MTAESLMKRCAELGIKLTLKSDDNSRLQVDAPKGALTADLRDALAAHKPDLIAILKTKQETSRLTEASTFQHDSEMRKSRSLASIQGSSPEATPVILQKPPTNPSPRFNDAQVEGNNMVSDSDNDEAINQLQTADSPSERAAAARKLGVTHNRNATAYLIASLQDGAPEVRRSATESLGQIGDPVAIPALNDLLLRETSRQLPEAVIRHAINSINVIEARRSSVPEPAAPPVKETSIMKTEMPSSPAVEPPVPDTGGPALTKETPAPKREIFADYLRSFEERLSLSNSVAPPSSTMPPASTMNSFDVAEGNLRREEEALRRAADVLEQKLAESDSARAKTEESRLRAEREAQVRMEIELRMRAEEDSRRRMAEEASRQKIEEEVRQKAEQDARRWAEQEAWPRLEEEGHFRLEAGTLRKAAEELARKRAEAEAARKLAEEHARMRAEHEAQLRAEEEALARAVEDARRQAEEDIRRRVEEEVRRQAEEESRRRAEAEAELRAAEEARLKAEAEARFVAELEAKRRAEEERQRLEAEERQARAALEARRLEEEERARREAEERHRTEEARLRMEQEMLMKVAAELSRRRSELEAARQNAETEARLLIEAEERAKADDESRRQRLAERQQLELEAKIRAEEEQLAEARRRAAEERQRAAEQARRQAEEEERSLAELELVRKQAAENANQRAEEEQRIRSEILALNKAEEEQRIRIEAAIRRRTEAQALLREQEARAEEETHRVAEEIRLKADEQANRRAEVEARLQEELARLHAEQEARARTEEEAHRLAEETRLKAEEEAQRRAEVERRLKEEEARLQAEQEARAMAEEEALRLGEEFRLRAEEESRLRSQVEERLKEEQARLEANREARARAEEALRLAEENLVAEEARQLVEAQERLREEARDQRNEIDLSESYDESPAVEASAPQTSLPELSWMDSSMDRSEKNVASLPVEDKSTSDKDESPFVPLPLNKEPTKEIELIFEEKGLMSVETDSGIPSDVMKRLGSVEALEREAALAELVDLGGEDAFRCINEAFDDPSADVRNAAARALYDLQSDRAATFTRALREGTPERRRKIGQALAGSGLAKEGVANLTGESREKTYDAFSLLFLMAKAGEVQPLLQAIEDYPNVEVRIAVVKLLALSGQPEVVPAFRRLAVRGSLPSEVRSAVMEAIYQISSQARETAPSAA